MLRDLSRSCPCIARALFLLISFICSFGAAGENGGGDNGGGGGATGELSLNVYNILKMNFGFCVSFEPHTCSSVPFPILKGN